MHNNYYFLKQLTQILEKKIIGYSLEVCFSQNKDELIIGFETDKDSFYIKASLDQAFCCLSFPKTHARSRKNSVNIFEDLRGRKVTSVYQYKNERCFSILLEDGYNLLFKMHGNRSNIILFKGSEIISLFKNNLKNDLQLDISNLNRDLDQSYAAFERTQGNYKTTFPTFGKVIAHYFKTLQYEAQESRIQWQLIEKLLKKFNTPVYYITEIDKTLHFSLINTGNVKQQYDDLIIALNDFFISKVTYDNFHKLKNSALVTLSTQIKQTSQYINKGQQRLKALNSDTSYRQTADLIMANLHQITPNTEQVTLTNFYDDNKPIKITLKKGVSAQKTAEQLYRKAKNQSIEIEKLSNNITNKETLLTTLEIEKKTIETCVDIKVLKELLKSKDITPKNKKQEAPAKPFRTYNHSGFEIWVGRNAKNNDTMLRQYAYKDDLWLHAKDVSGSHVLIKHQSGKVVPKNVIERAAELAAYHSKRKTDSLCPVIVTPRKFVRKRKGDPAGAVVVEKEDTIMVVPSP